MKSPLNILHLEDNFNDAELVKSMLDAGGITCKVRCVETKSDFLSAIEQESFDMVFSDFTLPSFDGLAALSILKRKCSEVPFIFISGTLGEELAIESLKKGATDYVLKQRMTRLLPAVHRALGEIKERTKRKQIEKELRENEEKYCNLFRHSNDAIFIYDLEGNILDANKRALDQFGYKKPAILALKISDLQPNYSYHLFRNAFRKVIKEKFINFEIDFKKRDGEVFPAEVSASLFEIQGKKVIQGIIRDATMRKRIEEMKREAGELKRVKQLAGAIAHEFSQPLQILSNSLYLMEEDGNTSEKIEICRRMIRRSVDLVSNLREITYLIEKDYLNTKIIDLAASAKQNL